MKCKNCGESLKKNELFCSTCGYYNGEKEINDWDMEESLLDESKENNVERDEKQDEENRLVESYVGKDYKRIKKGFFNIWAFLLNWIYVFYRKMYLEGLLGLVVSLCILYFYEKYLWIYYVIIDIILGLVFNKYYIWTAKRRVEAIKNNNENKDNYSLNNICMRKGGSNLFLTLIVYIIFLAIVVLHFVPIQWKKEELPHFWKENSENDANCQSLIKKVYINIEEDNNAGKASSAACKVLRTAKKEYEIYVKTIKDNRTIYTYYITENQHLVYKNNTLDQEMLEERQKNGLITSEEETMLQNFYKIEKSFNEIMNKSKEEEKLIEEKRNLEERIYYSYEREKIIR